MVKFKGSQVMLLNSSRNLWHIFSTVLKQIAIDILEDNSMVPIVSLALSVNVTLIVIALLLWLYAGYTKYKTQLV
jgi:hypothetical protein